MNGVENKNNLLLSQYLLLKGGREEGEKRGEREGVYKERFLI